MQRRKFEPIGNLIGPFLRESGLEAPLLQHRSVAAWSIVAGKDIAEATTDVYIRNQTLHVHISTPTLRTIISMQKQQLIQKIADEVGAKIIYDIAIH